MSIELFEHNQKAYDAAVKMLSETGKAAIIHPTGTGKSFIGFKYCEDNPDKIVCWLSPSRYIFETQIDNLKKTGANVPKNIKFFTYKKLSLMSDEEISGIICDAAILDEYHRGGAQTWGKSLKKFLDINSNMPIIGLSATNIRYLDNQRNMAEELFDGNIASEITLGDAIVQGILPAPKYIMTVFSYQNDLEKYTKKINCTKNPDIRIKAEKYLEKLRRAIENSDGLDEIFNKHMTNRTGKYIVFTQRADAMKECISHASEWFGKVDDEPHIYAVRTTDPETSKQFFEFINDKDTSHLRLLFCIDALNEGIHLDDIGGVILFRPTVSPIIYKQQIGRALSSGTKKTPVIFDIVNNIDNLYCVDSIKEEMRVAITYYNYLGDYSSIITERFEIIDEVADCRKLFKELDETLTVSWDIMYENARQYYIATGGLIFSRECRKEYCTLIKWIDTQRNIRSCKALGELSEEQIKKLDEIGMRWESVNDISWKRHFDAYKKYVENGGNLLVPQDFTTENGVEIGKWLCMLRIYKKSGIRNNYFTEEREKALEEVGIIWNHVDFVWERNYQAALSFFKREGNLEVPDGHIENGVKLYNWISDLRKKYRGYNKERVGTITDIQVQRLNELGMRWQSQADLIWEEGFNHAKAYYEETGAADAPFVYVAPDGYKLGLFLSKCREKFAKGKLSEERISRLNSINMVWNKSRKNDWDTCFEHAKAYYEEHSDLNIPPDYKADGIWLNKWLNEQRQIMLGKRKGKSLTEERIERLKSISFTGETPREIHWKTMLEAAEKFYKENGFDAKIPNDLIVDGTFLKTWVNNEQAISEGKLSNPRTREQIEKLKKIGIVKNENQTDKKKRACKDVQNGKGIML